MNRTIIIGDLHGCYDEALALLDRVKATANDRVIFVGASRRSRARPRECVELAMQHECVLGNHEEKHLQQRRRDARSSRLIICAPETRSEIAARVLRVTAENDSLAGAWRRRRARRRLPGHGTRDPERASPAPPAAHQPPAPKSYWPSKAPTGFAFWTNFWRGPERVIFGHTVVDRPLVTEHAVGIDTGAVFGGGLTALLLPSWELVTVPTPSYGGSDKRLGRYPLQNGVHARS